MFLEKIISLKFQRSLSKIYVTFCNKINLRVRKFSIILPLVLCSKENLKKLELPNPEKLTHHFLLKQASNVTANSASQLLNQTVSAIIDSAEEYRNALNKLMSLIEECLSNLGNEGLQQDFSDLIIEYRSKVNHYKAQFIELESFLEYVEKVVVSTSEATFLVGAEYSSISLSEHLYAAKQELLRIKRNIEILEHDYLKMQQLLIESTTKHNEDK